MRKINKIIIHCSATPEGKDFTVADITRWHKAEGYNTIGYHYVVYRDGSVHAGRSEDVVGAHCKGYNSNSIGVCYIGGLTADGKKTKDTRTDAQKAALSTLVGKLKAKYPSAKVHGHRDFAAKACPCFDATKEYGTEGTAAKAVLKTVVALVALAASLCLFGCSDTKYIVSSTVRTDTIRVVSHKVDTFISRDTVNTERFVAGDTVKVFSTITKWRERVVSRVDTFWRYKSDSLSSPQAASAVADLQTKLTVAEDRLDAQEASEDRLRNHYKAMLVFNLLSCIVIVYLIYRQYK